MRKVIDTMQGWVNPSYPSTWLFNLSSGITAPADLFQDMLQALNKKRSVAVGFVQEEIISIGSRFPCPNQAPDTENIQPHQCKVNIEVSWKRSHPQC